MKNDMIKQKIKKTLIQYYQQSRMKCNSMQSLGNAINWRLKLVDKLLIYRTNLTDNQLVNKIAGFCLVRRQIEAELDIYQEAIQELALDLQNGEITQDEFEDRLENITIAIIIIAFLSGSEKITEQQKLFDLAVTVLNDSGIGDDLDISVLPSEAQDQLNSEIALALSSMPGLSEAIVDGKYEEKQSALFNRLALWVTAALGVVSVGKLFLDSQRFLIWLFNPLKQHCNDCSTLNGQVHTVSEWNDFFTRTDKKPQGRGLECGGWKCGCGLFDADGPSVGNFV